MLDIKFVLENKDLIKEAARKKHLSFNVDELAEIDAKRRKLITEIEGKKSEQNKQSEKIIKADIADKTKMIGEMKQLKEEMQKEEEELKKVMTDWQKLMVQVPNVPDISVPEGKDDTENQPIKTWGEKPTFDFQPKSHTELMEMHDMLDLTRGAKVAGFRGYFLKNDAALLSFAIWQYGLEFFNRNKDFTPYIVPSLVRKESLLGTGYLPQGADDLYKTQDGDYLAGTGEVATMSYYSDEILEKKDLPLKLLSFSPCFRREAGSHGKDTKGIFRVHEFFKLEQVVLCEASHEESVKFHEWINTNTEEFIESLNLPYQRVLICGGDLGLGQVKKYDVNLWTPSENAYREISSASYFHDFQTRRLNIRYRDSDGKLKFAHSLNSTAIPTPRVLISLIENNQLADGTIKIPEALQKYMGNRKVIGTPPVPEERAGKKT